MKKIILTGGGTAGHVTPNLALVPKLKELGYEIQYIGTFDGIEKKIIEEANIPYHAIESGKLRRYFDMKNFSDPFKVFKGIWQARKIIKHEKPNIVFSKGGFVSVPVVIGAWLNKVPVIAHESDITPGLANKLSTPYCTKVCVTFPESLQYVSGGKGELTGTPIRKELLEGSRLKGIDICGFDNEKPVLLIIGGSLGSKFINDNVRACLDELLEKFNVAHICGKNNVDKNLMNKKGYKQFEFISDELPHVMKASDLVVSRAGANVICELVALKKPNLLIPLSRKSSRGDQILNADSFQKSGFSMVVQEEEITPELLLNKVKELYENKDEFLLSMKKNSDVNAVDKIAELIEAYAIKK